MSINFSVLAWTIINFVVLMLLLNRFLYQPIAAFMQQRQQRIDEGIAQGQQSQQQLSAAQKDLHNQRKTWRLQEQKSAEEALRQTLISSQQQSDAQAAAAKTKRYAAIEEFNQEQETLEKQLAERIPEVMEVLSRRLQSHGMKGKNTDALDISTR